MITLAKIRAIEALDGCFVKRNFESLLEKWAS
jgi:hypothetical protein